MKSATWFWYELSAEDPAAAAAWYPTFLSWKTEAWPDAAMQYTVINTASGGLGGIMVLAPEAKAMGAPPNWMGVVNSEDVDATVARCKELGGAVIAGPFDIPTVGRYAVLADPTGAVFAVLAASGEGEIPSNQELGRVSWNELWSSDPDAAFTFYAALFGWVETGTMDMGPSGLYRMYGLTAGGPSLGGIMKKMPEQPVSAWAFYFNVADVASALETVKSTGGTVVFGPHEVPGGGKMGMCLDPQGAVFAVYAHG